MASEVRLAAHAVDRHSRFAPALLEAMRPRQWVKNSVVALAPIFGMRFDPHTVLLAGVAFITFCAASSGIYLLNDVVDVKSDRLHPVKSRRPIAAGAVSVPAAVVTAGGLLSFALVLALATSVLLAIVVVVYLVIQVAYTFVLKNEPIVDIICISSGFVLRALAGAAAAAVPPSGWFLLCIALLALFLAIEKRKAEIRAVSNAGETREVLKAYSLQLLLRFESVATGGALISYGLWAAERTSGHWMLLTLPPVVYGLLRYQMATERGQGEEPDRTLTSSPHLLIAGAVWILISVGVLIAERHRELLPHF